MCNEIYGYIRVSTKEQNESRQLLALKITEYLLRISTRTGSRAAISTHRAING